ncbi:hypothetical protein [Ferrovibrio terrae]|uniref:hypothetical protein n=1 Tax=Ferrovibrio terrae TaxID=2594003 RepID=UPI00313785D5
MAGLPFAYRQSGLPRRPGSTLAPLASLDSTAGASSIIARLADNLIQSGAIDRERADLTTAHGEGISEGLAAAAEGRQVQRRTGGSAADVAYTRAVATSYFTRRQLNIDDAISGAAVENSKDVSAFRAKAGELKANLLSSVPPEIMNDVSLYIDKSVSENGRTIALAQRKDVEANANAVQLEAFTRFSDKSAAAWRSGNQTEAAARDLDARTALDARSDLTAPQKAAALLEMEKRGQRELLLGGFDRAKGRGLEYAESYIAAVRKNEAVEPDLRNKAADWMTAHVADLRRDAREAEQETRTKTEEQRQRWLSDFTLRFDGNGVREADIEDAYGKGMLKPTERTHFRQQLAKREGDVVRVDRALDGGRKLDPKEGDDRKAVDAHFKRRSAVWSDLDPLTRGNRELDYIAKVGVVPDSVQSRIRVDLRQNDPAKLAETSGFLDRLFTTNPSFRNDFSDSELSLADAAATRMRLGEPPEQAARAALAAQAATPQERKIRSELFKEEKPEVSRKWIKGKTSGGVFSSLPGSTEDALIGDFNAAYEQEFMAHGNAEVAKELAWKRLQRVWGESNADGGGKRWMRYAPEAIYGNGQDPEWIGEQLRADLKSVGAEPGEKAKLRLQPDALSAYETGVDGRPMPHYRIVKLGDDGAWRPMLDKDGGYLRWRPEWSNSPARSRLVDEAKGALKRDPLSAEATPDKPGATGSPIRTGEIKDWFSGLGKLVREGGGADGFRARFDQSMQTSAENNDAMYGRLRKILTWDFERLTAAEEAQMEALYADLQHGGNWNFTGKGR